MSSIAPHFVFASVLLVMACGPLAEPEGEHCSGRCDDLLSQADASTGCDMESDLQAKLADGLLATSAGEEFSMRLGLVDSVELAYPSIWKGELAIGASNGAHNQGLAMSPSHYLTTAQDREKRGWLFAHERSSANLACVSRLPDDIFGPHSTGRVHPGGGFYHDGWMYTVLSNHPSTFNMGAGAFVVAKFRPDPSCGDTEVCECELSFETNATGEPQVYASGGYHGFMTRVHDGDRASILVYDINGDSPWICNGDDGNSCQDLTALLEFQGVEGLSQLLDESTVVKPQQCFTIGETSTQWQMCTPFPLGEMRLSVHGADLGVGGAEGSLEALRFYRESLGTVHFPSFAAGSFGEGAVIEAGQIFVAGDAKDRADCGLLGLVKPCTSRDGKQWVRRYAFEDLLGVCSGPVSAPSAPGP